MFLIAELRLLRFFPKGNMKTLPKMGNKNIKNFSQILMYKYTPVRETLCRLKYLNDAISFVDIQHGNQKPRILQTDHLFD